MDETYGRIDPHAEIERLEARIEELAAQLESCRKFALAARVAIAAGRGCAGGDHDRRDPLRVHWRSSPRSPPCSAASCVSGSNRSTAQEAAAQMAAAERDRAALIGMIELRVVAERATLH